MRRIALVLTLALLGAVPAMQTSAGSEPPPVFNHYIGAVHEHSGYSDGGPGSRPADYYGAGKALGLDFVAGSEHTDNSDLPMTLSDECLDPEIARCALADDDNANDSLRKWDATKEQADAASDESFTGIRGAEWSSDRFGHMGAYFSTNFTNAYRDGGFVSMETYWEWFLRSPLLGGGADALGTFNHPGDKCIPGEVDQDCELDPAFNWNQFAYVPAADQRMVGVEVYNRSRNYDDYYVQALDAGWHVGAVGAEDKHEPDPTEGWGTPKWAKTVLIATGRTPEALREAMLARRMYAVDDDTLRMSFDAQAGRPMGSRIGETQGAEIPLTVELWNEAIEGIAPSTVERVELVTNGGQIETSADLIAFDPDTPELQVSVTVTDVERYYFVRVRGAGNKILGYSSPIWVGPDAATPRQGQWLAGDLHIHTTYSHDSYGGPSDSNTGPDEFYTAGHTVSSQFTVAQARGLDYLAITDHDDIRSQLDPGWADAKRRGLIPIPAYENSIDGHAQMLGATREYSEVDRTAEGVQAVADELRADGGVFQINHPMEGNLGNEDDIDWPLKHAVVPDTVEVWNISRLYQPPLPSASNNDSAVRFWEKFLDAGEKVGITAGSDNHWLSTTAAQGAGQPTTWVLAEDRTLQGILEGLRAGRTFISHQPPALGGPRLFLEADPDGGGDYEAMMGDTVPAGSPMRVRVEGAPGTMLRVFTDGGELAFPPVPVTSPFFEYRFDAPEGITWARTEVFQPDAKAERTTLCDEQLGDQTTYCRNELGVLAMTSAIYLETPTEGPSRPE